MKSVFSGRDFGDVTICPLYMRTAPKPVMEASQKTKKILNSLQEGQNWGLAKWSLIAGRIPGRSAEEIEKYWTSKYSRTNDQM
uniref:Myb-like domain-containing protein n=1 Tax=Lactuca sativa TaxID=4236 RepID=A0A9R1XJA9_LACSA|nr:hypothetical protein LSAT_V11C400183910 [Lactuca sativa]